VNYPPYSQPAIDPRSGLFTKPWIQFFLSLLSSGSDVVGAIPPGTVPLDRLADIASPRLLGRETAGFGPVEELLVGAGLTLTGLTLSATVTDVESAGFWTPISNGNPLAFELLYTADTGACVVGFVPTP
jgi:hypothetical protein